MNSVVIEKNNFFAFNKGSQSFQTMKRVNWIFFRYNVFFLQNEVNEFDYISIFGDNILGFGTLCEIYTPKKDVAEDVWYEIEKFDIVGVA